MATAHEWITLRTELEMLLAFSSLEGKSLARELADEIRKAVEYDTTGEGAPPSGWESRVY